MFTTVESSSKSILTFYLITSQIGRPALAKKRLHRYKILMLLLLLIIIARYYTTSLLKWREGGNVVDRGGERGTKRN